MTSTPPATVSISIDGPTASGKTTLGTEIASRLCAAFFDTGLTYRAVSYLLGRYTVGPSDDWRSFVEHRPLLFDTHPEGRTDADVLQHEIVLFQDKDVTGDLFAPELESDLSMVASDFGWRSAILDFHREIVGRYRPIVVVGRDVAETLLPDATLHVALTATLAVRRERRRAQYRELQRRSIRVGPATLRDLDCLTAIRAKPNSIVLDTSYLPARATLRAVIARLKEVLGDL